MSRQTTHFKLCLLGNCGVGKSCLVLRFIRNEFIPAHDTTVGAAFQTKVLSLPSYDAKVELWDTAGQERYRSLAPMYYRNAQAALVVYDITNRESFEGAKQWVRELKKKMEPNVVLALAANKSDLASRRVVDADEGALYAREEGLLYAETSAKDSSHVEALFRDIAMRVPVLPAVSARKEVMLSGGGGAPAAGAGAGGSGGGCC